MASLSPRVEGLSDTLRHWRPAAGGEIRALERGPTARKAPSWLNFVAEGKTIGGMHLSPRSALAITLLWSFVESWIANRWELRPHARPMERGT